MAIVLSFVALKACIAGEFIERYIRRYITEPRMLPFERTIPDDHKKKVDAYFKERFMLHMDEGLED